jgi:hypothetical protein
MTAILKFHLKEHCIECAAKRELKALMNLCFENSGISQEIEDNIELVRRFLNESDFTKLRADERLSGLVESFVYISTDENNEVKIEITSAEQQ